MDDTLFGMLQGVLQGNGTRLIAVIIGALIGGYVALCVLAWLSDKQQDFISRFYRPKKVLDADEEAFFKKLRAATPAGCFVFPHVSMRALIETNHWDFRAPLNLKRVDFVICDERLDIVCVVETAGENQKKRHLRREKMLMKAGVSVLRYTNPDDVGQDRLAADIAAKIEEKKAQFVFDEA